MNYVSVFKEIQRNQRKDLLVLHDLCQTIVKQLDLIREFVCHRHEMYAVRPTSIQGVSHLFAELSRFLQFYFKNHYCCIIYT